MGGGFTYLYLSLMLLCFCAIGVKADINGSVKFNSGVRYSQWAINSRAHDFCANTASFGLATYNADGTVKEPRNDNRKKLDYVPGLVAKSMIEAADYYQGFDWSKPWFLSVKEYGDAYDTLIPENGTSFDDLNGTKIYIGINSNNYASADDKKMVTTALASVKQGFIKANNTYVIPQGTLAENAGKNVAGGWWHKSTYKNQMWLDGAYMGSALLAQLTQFYGNSGNVFGSKEADWNMVAKQLNIVWDMCWNSTDKLMYHAFDATATAKATDNGTATWYGLSSTKPYNFHSAAYWGRANAWYLYALVDVLEAMEADGQKGTTNYTTLKGHLDELAAGIAARQDAKNTGGWFQLLDKDGNFVSQQYNGTTKDDANYIETSATALFSAALFKAVRLGLLSTSPYDYKTVAAKAFEGLVNNFVTYDADGGIQIWGSCKSAGLSGKNYRDGSNEYYLSGSDVTMVKKGETTEGKVLGGFIMAATEYERAYQNQDSKQILFAKDLAPSYDLSTAVTLDATAYGNGTITYQWYKDGNAIAKSATYTPTESGSYYCIAKSATNSRSADGNTIQTSTTTVTTANTNTDNGSTDNNGGSENGTTTGNIFSYTIKTTEKDANTPYDAEGGTVTLGSAKDDTKNGYKLDGEFGKSVCIKITLSGTKLQEGDIIKISAYSATAGKGGLVAYTGTTAGSSSVSLGSMTQKSEDISYTVKASDILNGLSTFYIYRKTNESTYVKSISITRANTQVALTASFSPATISATEGDVAQNLPTLTVEAGETTLTANDYTVTYTSKNDAVAKVENGKVSFVGKGETNIVATIKPTDTNKYKETSATFAVKVEKKQTTVDPTESGVIYDFTTSVGTTSYGTSCTSTNGIIKFGSDFAKDGKYITITPKTGGFKAGDVITLNGYCNSNNLSGVIIYSDVNVNGSSIFKSNVLAKKADGGSEFTYTIEKDCDALYLGRYGGGNTYLTSLKVERPASSSGKTRLTASFERNADVVVKTTTTPTPTVTLPTLTVQAGENILAADQYDVVYKSNAENVATLSGNTITINSLGIATITATVTPKDANTYEGTTATYQLSVKAPSPLNVSVMDVTINTTDAEEEQPVIKVYGDNDKLLKLNQDYTLSYAVSGDKNVTVDNKTGKFSVNKNAENTAFIEGTSLITVTVAPTESLVSNYTEGKLQFSYSVSEGKIKPVFLDSFKGITINLHQDSNNRTITVPLIHDGEDVSSYFIYTYTITPTGNTSSVTGSTLNFTPKTAGTYSVTVSATPDPNGTNDYSDVYDNPKSITFTLNVDSKYKTISVNPDPRSIKMDAGTTQVAPDLTVQIVDTKQTLGDTEYNVTWFSTSPGVVKVDAKTGKIEAVSEGTAKIRVVVSGENLESTTALISVEVDDRALYRVKGPESGETYGNQTRMWNQDRTLSVVLGGWLFPNPVATNGPTSSPKGPSTEGLSADFHWGTDKNLSSLPKWKLTGFDYYVVGDKNKNARQENGSNALPETTNIYSADFKSYTGTIRDNMFNVPCSGSFLEFNPATNGKVTVHIFQNGAFDSGVYRPQRRVFVMDEAGNFVESEAHIETTSGKPTGGIQPISSYKWDLNPKGKDTAPTIDQVRSHFKGIPTTFDMTANAFKNDVYESNLGTDIVPNAAANDRKGSHGWSVLADSPVTYTFNVKAGKTYYLYNFGSKIGFYGFSFDETKPTVDEVSYADDQSNPITATAAGHVAKVTVNRSMKKDVWTTCVLPFSLNRQQVDAIFGPAYSAAYPQGTQILYFDRVEGNKVFFVRHAYNTIVAGKPFLIKPTKDVTSINTAEVTDYPYVTIENTEPADWCTGNGYTWASSYSNDMTVKEGDGFISNKDGSFKNFVGTSGTLKGFRGYLKRLDTQACAKPMMLQVVSSSNIDGDNGGTTGIENLIITADGELMPANNRVYNINGQLVSEDASNFQSLPSGIYIINGKKYIK